MSLLSQYFFYEIKGVKGRTNTHKLRNFENLICVLAMIVMN